jgi:uncharacterized repeat protein (TIGR01451 family)
VTRTLTRTPTRSPTPDLTRTATPAVCTGALPLRDQANAAFLGQDLVNYAGDRVAMVGDVNNDGYGDFLIGAYNAKFGSVQAGLAYLFLGRPEADWGQGVSLADADAVFHGEVRGDLAARALAGAGDVNGDGYDDFLIGAYHFTAASNITETGKTYLLLGRAAADWGPGFPLADADASFVGEGPWDFSGSALAGADDVNGDGYDDFLIGAYLYDTSTSLEDNGKVYLLLGRPQADWGSDFPLANANASFVGEGASDQAGWSVASAGDVNGDGRGDLLIGAPKNDDGAPDAGKMYLLLGRANADWGPGFSLAGADAAFLGERLSSNAGRAVAGVGDANGDSVPDLLTGAYYDPEAGTRAGQAYLVLGRRSVDWGTHFSLANASASFLGAHAEDNVGGAASTAGDVNRDGYHDFLIAATQFDSTEVLTNSGRTYLVLGQADGWHMDTQLAQAETAQNMTAFDGEAAEDQAGYAVAGGGDVNGDGLGDFLVGAPQNDENGDRAGKAYLLLGRGLILQKTASSDTVLPSQRITYTLRYSNTTACDVQSVRVLDRIPDGVTYVGCSGGMTCTRQGPLVNWAIGTVDGGASGIAHMAVQVPPSTSFGTVITNTAWITAPTRLNPVFDVAVVRVGAPPTATPTRTPTLTPTRTRTVTPTRTRTPTPSRTPSGLPPQRKVYLPVVLRE